jgi:hypothetical protein
MPPTAWFQSRPFHDEPGDESHDDDREQADDHELERTLAARRLQQEQSHRDHADDHATEQHRYAEQQVERDRATDHLGDVRRAATSSACTQYRRRGQVESRSPMSSAGCAPVDESDLRGLVLHDHRDQVRHDEHPEQQVAVACTRGQVGGDIARVDVRDRGDERRTSRRSVARALGMVGSTSSVDFGTPKL